MAMFSIAFVLFPHEGELLIALERNLDDTSKIPIIKLQRYLKRTTVTFPLMFYWSSNSKCPLLPGAHDLDFLRGVPLLFANRGDAVCFKTVVTVNAFANELWTSLSLSFLWSTIDPSPI